MIKALIVAVFFAAAALATAGEQQSSVRFARAGSIFSFAPAPKSASVLGIDFRYNRIISLRNAEATALFFTPEKSVVISDFPVGLKDAGTVQLRRAGQISDAQTLWFANEQLRPGPKAVMYTGFIQNEAGSKVRLCMVNDRMYGFVTRATGETTAFAPDDDYNPKSGEHIMASDRDPRFAEIGKNFRCYADQFTTFTDNPDNTPFAMPTATNLLEVEVGVEIDVPVFSRFMQRNGNDPDKAFEATQAYIYSIFAMSSSIYEEEINVMLTVPFVRIWTETTQSGYPKYNTFGSDVGDMLAKASDVWSKLNNKTGQFKRDILHMCTAGVTGSGIFAGGVAYTGANYSGALCDQSVGYGVSGLQVNATLPVLAYTWDIMVITHEMGHNFRSPHTHTCSGNIWPDNKALDTCVIRSGAAGIGDACFDTPMNPRLPKDKGTIMSYCHLLNSEQGSMLEFRTIVAAIIRNGAERGVTRGCVTEPANPIIKLQYPLGRNTLAGGRTDTIRWTSAKVNTVRVEFSDNNGQSWTQIGSDVPAGVRVMPWAVPAKGSSQYLVRVIDPTNAGVGDSSWVAFTVQASSLALQYPVGGERVGQREKSNISWSSSLVSAVKVEFSSNGGAEWQTLSASSTGNTFQWEVPNIITNQAVVRVTALPSGGLVSQSQPFSIGKQMLQIINRSNLDTLCRAKKWKIQWTSDFMANSAKVEVGYSPDGGKTWTRLTSGLGRDVFTGIFENWDVPDVESADARLRIYRRGDETVADTVPTIITNCTFTSVNESWSGADKPTLELTPNPVRDELSVRVILAAGLDNAELFLNDANGRKVALLGAFDNLPTGTHSLHFDVGTVAQGAYFLTLQSGGRILSMPVRIVR